MSLMGQTVGERVLKHRALPVDSLKSVWKWVDARKDSSALAAAYVGACKAIQALDKDAACAELSTYWPKRDLPGHVHEVVYAWQLAHIYRDALARIILDHIGRLPK